jgi:uncharacterized coiled-coil DUF342 family protein
MPDTTLKQELADVRSDIKVIQVQMEHLEEMVEETGKKDDISVLKSKMEALEKVVQTFVTRPEFDPVKMIAYGMAGSVLLTVLGAILAKVIQG